ncbi:hypothetical protein I8752_25325 [Nostocaceae cyanobacterium CENA369]|uniref:Uncharacterized protein n=1 Tax=Dendronalium phyllosphericum CENA369 TaxID=1725256 RepID=A0A8J7IDW2_9NOST|nr:hypothetical protein [Dendronalium phyllosphericum]MBH8576252.1 hypothetical protein [Dendronalium phyllosphericum CENA369]
MSKFQIDIDFSNVDLTSLETDDDFKREAKILLPQALVKLGETVGEKTWDELNKTKGAGTKQKFSQSEKRKFVQETGKNYQRQASNRERQELENYIVEQLRTHKEGT